MATLAKALKSAPVDPYIVECLSQAEDCIRVALREPMDLGALLNEAYAELGSAWERYLKNLEDER